MALEYVKEILLKAALDERFREKFFSPKTIDDVLVSYKGRLSEEEEKCLRELKLENIVEDMKKYFKKGEIMHYSDIRL